MPFFDYLSCAVRVGILAVFGELKEVEKDILSGLEYLEHKVHATTFNPTPVRNELGTHYKEGRFSKYFYQRLANVEDRAAVESGY